MSLSLLFLAGAFSPVGAQDAPSAIPETGGEAASSASAVPPVAQSPAVPQNLLPSENPPSPVATSTAPPAPATGTSVVGAPRTGTGGTSDAVQAPAPKGIPEFQPILFTYWEHVAIQDARNSRGLVRAPSAEELARSLRTRDDLEVKPRPPPEERELFLSGIVYKQGKNWTIWLNGKRVTPDALPVEILDLKVYKTYVEMKWFDEYTNQIFPIRLRPHQRFNIDTRIFLPG